jgi:hypothetical protein
MIQQKQDTTIFHLYSKAANTQMTCELLMKKKIEGVDVSPSILCCQLPAGENVSHEATKPRGRSNAALYRCFNH